MSAEAPGRAPLQVVGLAVGVADLRHDLGRELLDDHLGLDLLVDEAGGPLLADGLAQDPGVDGRPRIADRPLHGPLRELQPVLASGPEGLEELPFERGLLLLEDLDLGLEPEGPRAASERSSGTVTVTVLISAMMGSDMVPSPHRVGEATALALHR